MFLSIQKSKIRFLKEIFALAADRILAFYIDRNIHFTQSFFHQMRRLKLYNSSEKILKFAYHKHGKNANFHKKVENLHFYHVYDM